MKNCPQIRLFNHYYRREFDRLVNSQNLRQNMIISNRSMTQLNDLMTSILKNRNVKKKKMKGKKIEIWKGIWIQREIQVILHHCQTPQIIRWSVSQVNTSSVRSAYSYYLVFPGPCLSQVFSVEYTIEARPTMSISWCLFWKMRNTQHIPSSRFVITKWMCSLWRDFFILLSHLLALWGWWKKICRFLPLLPWSTSAAYSASYYYWN